MIKLVAFDWNGTIVADAQPAAKADEYVWRYLKMPLPSVNKMRSTFDVPIMNYYLANGMTEKQFLKHKDRIRDIYHSNFERLSLKCRTRRGIVELLQWLKNKNIDRMIFSNHNLPNITFHLKRLHIDQYFNTVQAHHERAGPLHERTKGAKLDQYIRQRGYKKSEVLVVGDTIEEIEIAQTLALRNVAITGGHCSTVRLKAVNPDFLIHNMVELEKIIKFINRR